MDAANSALTVIADWLLSWPSARWPLVTLLFWSAVAGVMMTALFRYTSNQRAVKAAADRSHAQTLALKLFGHDPVAVGRSFFQLLRYTGLRLWHSLPPTLVMLVPFAFVFPQLALRYEYRPIADRQPIIVKLEFTDAGWPAHQQVILEVPRQIIIETPPLHDATEHAMFWRLRATRPMATTLRWRVDNQWVEKRFIIDNDPDRLVTISARRPGRGWLDRLMYPAEPALAATSPISGVEIAYPLRDTPVAGINIPWWLTFVLASIMAALVARPFLGVRF